MNCIPECSRKYLIDKKSYILESLCLQGYISERNLISLLQDANQYWEFIRKIPFEYLYPKFYKRLIQQSCKLLNIDSLLPLYLEDNWPKVLSRINDSYSKYSIYALRSNGDVCRYYIKGDIETDYRLVKQLNSKASLSGNSAILLRSIGHRIGEKTIVGYRPHRKSIRPNRNHALEFLLTSHDFLVEPSNLILNQEFDKFSNEFADELKTNIVYAKMFRSFLKDNASQLNI